MKKTILFIIIFFISIPLAWGANVKDFGAIGDGITNDTLAINAAILSESIGGVIYFPAGNYLVSPVGTISGFTLTDGKKIKGDGIGSTIIICNNITRDSQNLFYINSDDSSISELTIDGGGSSPNQSMIMAGPGHSRLTLKNLYIKNTASYPSVINLADGTYDVISNVKVDAFIGTLVSQTAKTHGILLVQTNKSPTYHKISNLTVLGGFFGLMLKNQQFCVADNLIIVGPMSPKNDSGDGININNSDYCSISNVQIVGRQDGGLMVYSEIPGQVSTGNNFSNITSSFNNLDGVYLASGISNQYNNIITIGNRFGVYLSIDDGGPTERNMFNGVLATNNQYGIHIGFRANNNFFSNCRLDGNKVAKLDDLGKGNVVNTSGSPVYKDFNGDGNPDILWRNSVTGEIYIWLMDGGTIIAKGTPATVSDLNWKIIEIADFDGDGRADILWKHAITGQIYVWLMDGINIKSIKHIADISDTNWQIIN